ncbi:MAG: NifB/NifX family molybdenum-iron cluster-binding protein [Bacteroidales bacterium]
MKIAVPTQNNKVDDHFGHCEYYTIFEVENNKIIEKTTMPSPQGCGCKSNIAPILSNMGVKLMLAGSMGEGAKNVLESNNIAIVRGCTGLVDEVVAAYLNGSLLDSGEGCHHHHEGEGEHQCNNK